MWYPTGDFTLRQAKDFLRKDFLKVVRRTKYLYVEKKPTKKYGAGFFEPILLFLVGLPRGTLLWGWAPAPRGRPVQ